MSCKQDGQWAEQRDQVGCAVWVARWHEIQVGDFIKAGNRPCCKLAHIFIQQGWAFSLKPWFWANLWPCELLGFGIPCLTFADLWSLQGQSSCKFWLWPCPCSWRFNISYAMLTGFPFPIVLMHSPILGLWQSCQSLISELFVIV